MGLVVTEFSAPWSRPLQLMTALALAVLLSVALMGLIIGDRQSWIRWLLVGLPLAVVLATLPFMHTPPIPGEWCYCVTGTARE